MNNDFCNNLDCGDAGWQQWVIVNGSSTWTKQDLEALHNDLFGTKNALANVGINWTQTNLWGVQFERVHGSAVNNAGNRAYYYGISHKIKLSDNAFNGRTIIHELGHAIDRVTPFTDLHDSYAEFSGSCWLCGEIASGYYFRSYGRDSQYEGWADAFSVWVYMQNNAGRPPTQSDWEPIGRGLSETYQPDYTGMHSAVVLSLNVEYGVVLSAPTNPQVPIPGSAFYVR